MRSAPHSAANWATMRRGDPIRTSVVAASFAWLRTATPALTIFSHSRFASSINAGNSAKRPTSTAETIKKLVLGGQGRAATSSENLLRYR